MEVLTKDFVALTRGASVLVPGGSTQESRHPCETPAEFVRRLVAFLKYDYDFHIWGRVPDDRTPEHVDRVMLEKYPSLGLSLEAKRQRSKRTGESKLQYLRFQRNWIILATRGSGDFWEKEKQNIRKHRKEPRSSYRPIIFWGYSISTRSDGLHVRIRAEEFKRLKKFFLDVATRRDLDWWRAKLWKLPFEPYAPVLRQVGGLIRRVNKKRMTAGLPVIPESFIRQRRNLSG